MVLVTPVEYYGAMVEVLKTRRSSEVEVTHVDGGQVKTSLYFTSFYFIDFSLLYLAQLHFTIRYCTLR